VSVIDDETMAARQELSGRPNFMRELELCRKQANHCQRGCTVGDYGSDIGPVLHADRGLQVREILRHVDGIARVEGLRH
jgi:hypothetical protein